MRRIFVTRGMALGVASVLTAAVFFVTERMLLHYGALTGVGVDSGAVSGFPADLHILAHLAQVACVALVVGLAIDAELLTGPTVRRLVAERQELSAAAADRDGAVRRAREMEARAVEAETRFRSLFESAGLGMALCNGEGQLLEVNRSLCDLLGYSARELHRTSLLALTHKDDVPNAAALLRAIAGGASGPFRLEQRYLTADAREIIAQVTVSVVRGALGEVLYCPVQIENITARRRAEESLARYTANLQALTLTDDLTGLHNRRGFRTVSEQLCAAQRRSKQPLMLVAVDVDYLKAINDTWGHEAGDRAIVIVASALHKSFRTSDVVARVGGDEFLCMLPNAGSEDVTQIRLRIASRIARELEEMPQEFPLTVTVGAAIAPPLAPVHLDNLMREADRALYAAKRGRPMRHLVGVKLA
ncbi:MAG TPA: diguanylate cyclase [Vicinamibacterales bacterium]|nr:diguanylate cyclase [Vicinamibacterales bacterium]